MIKIADLRLEFFKIYNVNLPDMKQTLIWLLPVRLIGKQLPS